MTSEAEVPACEILNADPEDECLMYREIFENAVEGIFRTTFDGQIKVMNPAMIKMMGFDSESDLRMSIKSTLDQVWVDLDERKRFIDQLIQDGVVRDYETRFIQKDGQVIWVSINCRLVKGANDQIPFLEGFIENITKRKQDQDLIQKQEILFQMLFDAAPDGIVLIGLDGKISRANIAQARMYSYESPTKLIGVPAKMLVAPSSREYSAQILQRRLNGEEIPPVAYQLIRKDGSLFFGETSATILRNDQGDINGYICVTRDTTERTQAETEIRESKQLLETIVENVPIAMFLKDSQDLRYVMLNKSGESLIGYRREDVIGKTSDDIFPLDVAAYQLKQDQEALASDGVQDFPEETFISLKNGPRLIHSRKVAIKGGTGSAKYLLGISEDVTERRQMEAEQKSLEDQLRSSQKLEAIGRLAGGIAHDFNNLLSVILNFNSFALDTVKEGSPIRQDLLEVKKAADRAASLTRQLLAFSRRQILHPVRTNLNTIAVDCEKMFRRTLGEDIELILTLSPDLGQTMVDPGQIEQVLLNLVINARDAMPNGGQLTIKTESIELKRNRPPIFSDMPAGQYVRLSVSDNGIGMDEPTRSKIFDPFFTTKSFGSGLGLPTVYGIIRQSGGNIKVSSKPGSGTCIEIYLPLIEDDHLPMAIDHLSKPLTLPGNETILVVEDEEALRQVIKRILEGVGYQVLTAVDGEDACLIYEKHRQDISLLLTDVVMPLMGGKTLVKRLKESSPKLKVLYISGYNDDALVTQCEYESGSDFLAKPFNSSELTRKVRSILDSNNGR